MDPDLSDFFTAYFGGDVPDERKSFVLDRLRMDPVFQTEVVEELRLFGMLKVQRTSDPRWLRLEDELGWSSRMSPVSSDFIEGVVAEVDHLPVPSEPAAVVPRRKPLWRQSWAWAAAVILLAIISGTYFRISNPPSALVSKPSESIAILVRLTGTGWEAGTGPVEGSIVRTGVLILKDGSASIAYFNGVTLHVEGPAVVDLQSPNQVLCKSGKFRFVAPLEGSGFTVLAPGTSIVDPLAEFALTVEDQKTDLMVTSGQAEVALVDAKGRILWSQMVSNGEAVRLDSNGATIVGTSSLPAGYAHVIPSLDPQLSLDAEYPAAVRSNRPVSYWRFESAEKGIVPNEIPTGPSLQLIGEAGISAAADGNRCLNLPPSNEFESHGALSTKSWTPRSRNYAVECWVMPRAVRHASLVGLVTDDNQSSLFRQYGALLELTGQTSTFRLPLRSVRALHRSQAEPGRGVSIFTPTNYLPYSWQHLVMQRSGTRLELYVNGELAAVAPLSVDLPLVSCRTLIGALHAQRDGSSVSDRPFIGLIDEVAIYDHALRAVDIAKHFRLATTTRSPN